MYQADPSTFDNQLLIPQTYIVQIISVMHCSVTYNIKLKMWVLVSQDLGSTTLPQTVPLVLVCADGFHPGKVSSSDTASAEAVFTPVHR